MRIVKIGNRLVGEGHPCFITAEIGINHNGSIKIVRKLIDLAVQYGADAVKFQKRTVPAVYSASELIKPREVLRELIEQAIRRGVLPEENTARLIASDFRETTNGDLKWALEFTRDEYREIDRYAREKGIMWYASPWDPESVDFLEEFNPPCYKVPSALVTHRELLRKIRDTGRPVIVSTGMSTEEEIYEALKILGDEVIILHCTSSYPSENHELNLTYLERLRSIFHHPVGYSGHETDLIPSVVAAVKGACMVERHITLDHSMYGSDQRASLGPDGLNKLVKYIRVLPVIMGDGRKVVYPSEVPIREKLRKVTT